MYHDLYLGEKALVGRENVGFDLTKSDICPSFVEDLTAKGVGLRVVLNYFKVHISQFNPFGLDKLATFAVMWKAYDVELSVKLLRAFLNLDPASRWFNLSNRWETNVPKAISKPFTHING
ncbi:hypothetical protein Tco_0565520 [Tanacetum coccineum]